jgi:hypothetical protein
VERRRQRQMCIRDSYCTWPAGKPVISFRNGLFVPASTRKTYGGRPRAISGAF